MVIYANLRGSKIFYIFLCVFLVFLRGFLAFLYIFALQFLCFHEVPALFSFFQIQRVIGIYVKIWVVNEFGPYKRRGPCTNSLDPKTYLQFHSDRGFQNINAILGTQLS